MKTMRTNELQYPSLKVARAFGRALGKAHAKLLIEHTSPAEREALQKVGEAQRKHIKAYQALKAAKTELDEARKALDSVFTQRN
jgi:ferric-dicitrate binding protein FerR (iron transport regulator)